MQALLLERATGRLRPHDFSVTVTESLYAMLRPMEPNLFPDNCHHNAAVNSLSIENTENRYMLSGCADSSVKLWDLRGERAAVNGANLDLDEGLEGAMNFAKKSKKNDPTRLQPLVSVPRRAAHNFGVSAVQWWPRDTGMFISASFDHTVKVWDTNAVEVVHVFDVENRVYAIDIAAHEKNAFSSSALIAVASDQPFIRLLDLRSAASAHTLLGHKGKTLAVRWHPRNGYLLASGGHDGEAKVWDVRMAKSCVARLDMTKTNARAASEDALNLGASSVKAHSGPVNAVVWEEAGHVLYTAGNDDKIRVWDMAASTAPPINRLVNFGPLTRNKYLQSLPLVLSPRSETEVQHLLFASDNGDVLVFRAIDGKLVSRLQRAGSRGSVRTASIAYAGPNSAMYYCGTMDGEIVPWRGEKPRGEVTEMGGPRGDLEGVGLKRKDVGGLDEREAKAARSELYDDPYFKHELG